MSPARNVGRIIGVLLLVQLVGLALPFILSFPGTGSTFLENATGASFQIKVAIFLFFANSILTLGVAIGAFPIVREHSYRMALLFVCVSVIWVVMQSVDNAFILSMLSMSQQYADAGAANADLYGALAATLRGTRRWIHFTELLVIDAWFFIFYAILFRFALVPRLLAGFGLFAVILHAAGIPLPVFAGYNPVMQLGWTLAISHVVVGGWLAVKGFETSDTTRKVEAAVE